MVRPIKARFSVSVRPRQYERGIAMAEYTLKEIYDVLVARPDIKQLFKTILSAPEDQRKTMVKMVTAKLTEMEQRRTSK